MEYFIDIIINLTATIIGWLMVIALGFYAVYIRARNKRKLQEFLGVNRHRTNISVYLSSLNLSLEVDNVYDEKQHWEGVALSAAEFEIIPQVDRWLQPLMTDGQDFVEVFFNYITPNNMKLPKVSIEYIPTPRSKSELKLSNTVAIVIGGCAHNYAARIYSDENRMTMETKDAEQAVEILKGVHSGKLIKPSDHNLSENLRVNKVAKVEKVYDPERNSVVFFAEGVDTNGTLGAVVYLISNWERLVEQFNGEAFSVCIECPSRERDKNGYLHPTVLFELPKNS